MLRDSSLTAPFYVLRYCSNFRTKSSPNFLKTLVKLGVLAYQFPIQPTSLWTRLYFQFSFQKSF